jgi:hypothetical protein
MPEIVVRAATTAGAAVIADLSGLPGRWAAGR